MTTDEDRQPAGRNNHYERVRVDGTESPRELLAVHDPSRHRSAAGRTAAASGHGVSVQWLRPTELAARVAASTAAGAVAAHVAAHRHVRDNVRARLTGNRLAPASAFGRQAESRRAVAERSVISR
jgi:hypothetical protein